MGQPTTTCVNTAAHDLLDRWLAHHEQEHRNVAEALSLTVVDESRPVAASVPAEAPLVIETVEEFEEFTHPVPALGGAAGAPSPSSLETHPDEAPLPAPVLSLVATGAPVLNHP